MSNSQLRTDIPVLPSLPPNLSPANPDAPPSPDTPFASPATPVGQMVETPNWSERLETGTIEFEIAPGKDGQPEARVLAMADAVAPLDELVVWGKPVDGLQAGFWPASTGEPLNQRVPLDALVEYHVVVKNTSSEARNVCWQLISFDRGEIPWLIPSDPIVPAMELPAPPAQFRAVGSPNPFSGIDPAFIVRLEPNETVMVPGPQRLWIGKTLPKEHQYTPHLADLSAGMNWIVQPIRVKTLTDKERFEYKSTTQTAITVYDAQGQSRTVKANTIPARYADPSIYARIQLEVGTLNAEAHRSAEQATWGEVDRGLQCGVRLLNPQASYQTGDTIQAELLYRNSSDKVLITTQPRSTDFWARVEDSAGLQLPIDDGARLDLLPPSDNYQPGEVRSLGTLKMKLVAAGTPSPKDNREPGHTTLPPGKYKLHGSGGVGEINPHSGKIAFIVAEPVTEQPAPVGSKAIRGQIINDLKLGVPNADVLIVAGGDLNEPREGKVIDQGKTDVLGNYSIAIPEAELGKRSWGQVWRRAPGFAATRGNTMQSLESLTEQPLQHNPLVSTKGLHLVVQDPAGKPLANARVEAISVKVNQGIGYTLPAAWRDDNSGVTDAEGRVHLPYIDPGSLNQLEITPEGSTAVTRFSPNYFLNYRPEETAPHFIFPTYKTGTIEGQLVAGPGVTLPKDLKIPLMTLTGKVDVSGVREVTVDEAGRFQIPDMPIGEISILKFLDDAQPLRSWISERSFVKAGETTKLEIPIVTGTRVTGRVQKSDTKASVADYEFEVYYGPAITFRGSDLWLLKHPVKTDAEGKYELLLPPGSINLRLTRYVDGYSDTTSWLPDEQQGTWGPLVEIPAQADFELPSIELVKMLPIQGKLIDQNDQPLGAFDWMVYGYPAIPGKDDGFVMNSMAGVQTDKTGHFDGTYPETYPPVRWSVSHRIWKTKYEFDDIKYAAKVVTRDPLVLRVDTTTPLEE